MGVPAPLGVGASGLPASGDQANAVISGVLSAVGPTAPFAFRGPFNVAIWASQVDALTVTAGSLAAVVATGTGIAAGDAINSALVPPGATVGAIAGTAVTMALPPITLFGTTVAAGLGYAGVISGLKSTAGLLGAAVTGPNIPAGTTVTGIITPYASDGNSAPNRGNEVRGVVGLSAAPLAVPAVPKPQPFVFARNGNAITAGGTDAAASFTGNNITYTGSVQLERSFDGGATWLVCRDTTTVSGMAIYGGGTPINFIAAEPEKDVFYRLNATALSGTNLLNFRISATGQAAESYGLGLLN